MSGIINDLCSGRNNFLVKRGRIFLHLYRVSDICVFSQPDISPPDKKRYVYAECDGFDYGL